MPDWFGWLTKAIAVCFDNRNWTEAYGLANLALNLDETQPAGHLWAGIVLRADGNFAEAERAIARALALDPTNSVAEANLAALILDRDPNKAVEMLRSALAKDPGSDFIAQHYMLAVLSAGDYEPGWNLYNRRSRFPAVGNQICKYPTPVWDGIKKGKVLLVGEEGIGERIMFASMVKDVIKAGATPMIEVTSGFERFTPWFKRSFPGLKICQGGEKHSIDYHITIGDLGHMFRRRLADFPKHKGYMTWDKKRANHFRHRLSPGPVIGICYKSCANAGPYKSIPLEKLAPVLNVPGATFVDIQYQGTEKERNEGAPLMNHLPDLDLIRDMDGTAALIGACDLVITVSSVAAHMAGAMGKPVWTFIPARGGRMWFWGVEGKSSPWYPSMTLHRQTLDGDWAPAIEKVAENLHRFVSSMRSVS